MNAKKVEFSPIGYGPLFKRFKSPINLSQYPHGMPGGNCLSYILKKIPTKHIESIKEKGIIIYENFKTQDESQALAFKPVVREETFLPEIYELQADGFIIKDKAHHAFSVYGQDIDMHLLCMLELLGINGNKVKRKRQETPFSMERFLYECLNIPKITEIETLTIGRPEMLKPTWQSLVQENAYNKPFLTTFIPGIDRCLKGAQQEVELNRRANNLTKQLLSEENQKKYKALLQYVRFFRKGDKPIDEGIRRILDKVKIGEDSRPFEEKKKTFIKNSHALKFNKRTYGYLFPKHLFLSVDMFYGELSSKAAYYIAKNHGIKQLNFFGTTGGLSRDLVPGKSFIPTIFETNSMAMRGVNDVSVYDLPTAVAGKQLYIPSLLLETKEVLAWLASAGDSVDCESSNLAFLKRFFPETKFKMILRVSDNAFQGYAPQEKVDYDYKPVLDLFGLPY